MAKRNFDAEFEALMVTAAIHDDGTWTFYERGLEADILLPDREHEEGHVVALVAEHFAIGPDAMKRVLEERKSREQMARGET